ncbi:MAG: potassium transporter [Tenericutes bacterium GWF2_57_13]|nr:MAG: potassium transporter [Tenericutes bacterium GWF2_57_13]
MILSFALIILVGFALSELAFRLRLPRIVGMIFAGILLGPYVLNLIAPEVLSISIDLRQIALVIILLRAGLALDLRDLQKVGRPALLLSFVPATFELVGVLVLGPLLLGLTLLESAILGTILAAVSPAVVVPRMLKLIEEGRGTAKGIPQMIMAGASVDDIYVIVLFTAFVRMAQSGDLSLVAFLELPIALVLGVAVGALVGIGAARFFRRFHMRDTTKVLVLLSLALLFVVAETAVSSFLPFSGFLAVLAMGIALLMKYPVLTDRLVHKYEKIWVFAETLLFVLVGVAVDIRTIPEIGLFSIALIFGALLFRTVGVLLSTAGRKFTGKERLFVVVSYLPKATVQASIGSIPLALGISNGNVMLTIAVLAILVTAPMGAFLMDLTKHRLLEQTPPAITDPESNTI